jgi:endonuclease YncB( thermonuclease family)
VPVVLVDVIAGVGLERLRSGAFDDDVEPAATATVVTTGPGAGSGSVGVVVSNVVDGDTLRLTDGRSVRLVQIDSPEARTECYGEAATAVLTRLTPRGTSIGIEGDPGLDDRDEHGRLLRYVVLGDTVMNVELVRLGAAVPYFFRKDRGAYADRLLEAADEARAAHRGMWKACPDARLDPYRGALTGRS